MVSTCLHVGTMVMKGGLEFCCWYGNNEFGPCSGRGGNCDISLVQFNNAVGQRQAKTKPALLGSGIYPVKWLENIFQFFFGNAHSFIAYSNGNGFSFGFQFYRCFMIV